MKKEKLLTTICIAQFIVILFLATFPLYSNLFHKIEKLNATVSEELERIKR